MSYGTFSCTLEGFDDAFSTMKAIAEYFRDLAAEDRFFGAEPPTPDPEMLAQLASRSAARRVEAHRNETGIVLRQDRAALADDRHASDAVADAAEETAEETGPQPDATASPPRGTSDTADAPPPAAPAADAGDTPETDEPAPKPVPEAAAVEGGPEDRSEPPEAPREEPAAATEPPAEEAAPAPRARVVRARPIQATTARSTKPRPNVRVSTSSPRTVRVSAGRPAVPATPTAPAAPATPAADQNSVAAKLQRIRDVVAKDRKPPAVADYSEDQHADEGELAESDALLGNMSDADNVPLAPAAAMPDFHYAEDDLEDDEITEDSDFAALDDGFDADEHESVARGTDEAGPARQPDVWLEDTEDLDLSAAMAIANAPGEEDLGDEDLADDVALTDVSEDDDIAAASDADEDMNDLDDGFGLAAYDDDDFDDLSFDDGEDDDHDDLSLSDPHDDPDHADEVTPEPAGAQDTPARPVARVLKVKRRDFEEAVREGRLEEEPDTDGTEAALPETAYGESTLSPEDEAELQSELKALEAEISGGGADAGPGALQEHDDLEAYDEEDAGDAAGADNAEPEEVAEQAAAPAVPDEAPQVINPRRRLLRKADDDMDRILAETDNQLGDSDGTRRRSAIAHLRAAVAATKAEKQAGADFADDDGEATDAYRDDLAHVVRPRRPVPRGDAPSRRTEDRPAPLKLVAEQRVDVSDTAQAGPIRPRRVRVSDIAERQAENEGHEDLDMDHEAEAHARATAANAASFSEFADRVGAYELPDILEAAASYLAFVEGRGEFTRPQLMTKARQALEGEFSREDGLRHFGRLLREGKLRKVAAGQFSVSERINFRPEERAAV
ncbi:lipoprotein, putative [Pseudooceanicola batsensis HTCC2597]|uniref:Lipoprotein, putative n=1 Tax=Pseudooceanicola batsensis (strain ATCC BAA-863 / DSM 15984 / KCTC 12145 / HTCC2597) TaxID=252305 RepID=A3TUM6_PSEBH|nr:lipoprotein, putative [Pseudooceanicola batsensis HTCC2597]